MAQLQPVRGTQDLLPDEARRHRTVIETARAVSERYGFAEIATPIFEFTEVFARPIGETTDIVAKEMYTFTDRGGEEVTLRPENTAGVVRAVLSNGLTQSTPLKFFYSRPDVPLRAAAEGPLSPVPPDRRRADRRRPAAGRHRGHRAWARRSWTRSASSNPAGSNSIRWATRRAAPPIARRWSSISART